MDSRSAIHGFERQVSDSWEALGQGRGSVLVFLDHAGSAFDGLCQGLAAQKGFERAAFLRFDPRREGIGPFSPLAEGLRAVFSGTGAAQAAIEDLDIYPRHRPLWRSLLAGSEAAEEEPLIPFEAAQERVYLRRDLERLCARAAKDAPLVIACDNAEDLPLESLEALDPETAGKTGPILVLLRFSRPPQSSRREEPAANYFRDLLAHGRVFTLDGGAADSPDQGVQHISPPGLSELRSLQAFLHYRTASRRAWELFQASVREPKLLSSEERAELRAILAVSWAGAGNTDLGLYHAQALWSETRVSGTTAERRRALLILARLFREANDPGSAVKTATTAWKELDASTPEYERSALEFLLFHLAPRDGSHSQAFSGLEARLIPLLDGLGWKNHLSAVLSQVVSARETVEREGLPKAMANVERGLALARQCQNLRAAGVSLQTIGMLYDLQGRTAQAEQAYIQARETRAPIALPFELARNDNGLGYFYFIHGDYPKAFARHAQALKALSLSRNYEETMGTLFNLGRLYLFNGQAGEGLFCVESLLRIKEGLEIEEIPFHSRRNIFSIAGICCLKTGRTGQAMEFARRIAALPPEAPKSPSLDYQRWFDCLSSWIMGQGAEARKRFMEAEEVLAGHAGDTRPLLRMLLLDRAAFERSEGRTAAERRALSEAQALAPQARPDRPGQDEAGRPPRYGGQSLPLLDFNPAVILHFMEQDRTLIHLQRKINEFGFLQAWQEVLRNAKTEEDILDRALDLVKRHFLASAVLLYEVAAEDKFQEGRRLQLTRGVSEEAEGISAFLEERYPLWGEAPRYWEGLEGRRGSYLPIRILGSVGKVIWVQGDAQGLSEDDHLALVDAAWQAGLALELLRLQQKLTEAATTDMLTGLNNRAEFLRRMDYQFRLAKRHGKGQRPDFCLLFIDLDNFKHYNDDFGHAAGDLVLRLFASTLASLLRATDVICRYGGDEFVVLLPATDPEGAQVTADRIIQTLRQAGGYEAELAEHLGRAVSLPPGQRLTCSIGISPYAWDGDFALDQFIAQADKAAYQAKRAGKDRFALA